MNIVGEKRTVFYNGIAYRFEYIGNGDCKCVTHDFVGDMVVELLMNLVEEK